MAVSPIIHVMSSWQEDGNSWSPSSYPPVMRTLASIFLFFVLSACQPNGDCSKWSDRPNCEPVGTTSTIKAEWNDDPSCVETRFFDEQGEASGREIGCS